MRKFLLVILLLITYYFSPTPALAHLSGQPPYLKINGQYTNLYPVLVSSASNFNLPQDLSSGTFTTGQKIDFVMETDKLPAPPEIVKKTKFTWDFGDGSTKTSGLSASHIYNRMGSFIQTIYADDGTVPEPQLLSSVLINILPDPNYKLPQPLIYVNGVSPSDPLTEPLKFDLSKTLLFDGSKSVPGTGKIISYSWDLGDGTTQDKASFSFQYSIQINQTFPVLRVKDENGFIADTYVELETGNPIENNAIIRKTSTKLTDSNFLFSTGNILIGIGVLAMLILIVVITLKKRRLAKKRYDIQGNNPSRKIS